MRDESEKKSASADALSVGTRVSVRRQAEAATGVIVEDYAELTDTAERGHDWAPVHRWAVALDDGRLVFADTEDLTVDIGTGESG
ncbi:hypothetical protein CJ179_34535 [Rhodococcus sp. ACS1]|uniref:Uncharacterized protein n=1 Tax=Rhodococcus jostii TaxID=132919 RepID=A0A1H5LUG3_RHOJO|nr:MULTISPECIES: hypothetical protein [Rhodococcus]PBC39201.1 hypothetical protein CJ179_34535 [Rhodococcus sp. ACS1]SEC60674.1 hypothetical protein SAMN04490220_2092 [Rhodococcus jostii]SEE80117.1 hypothetical protein SAMN04490220_8391 [Rhodococcus jostii]